MVDADGIVLGSAQPLATGMMVADIKTTQRRSRDASTNAALMDDYVRLVTPRARRS